MKEDLAEVHSKRRRSRKDGKKHGYFEEVIFSVADWQALRDMLDILTVSVPTFQYFEVYMTPCHLPDSRTRS